MKRKVFFISDSTGITAETLGYSLLAQFPATKFETETIPYVDSIKQAKEAVTKINAVSTKNKALVFSTLVNDEIRNVVKQSNALFMDFFDTLVGPIENELKTKHSQDIGKFHSILDKNAYDMRIAAIDFALSTDDGVGAPNYTKADVILVGVSRSGKTPTCLYLALVFGILAANYPITEEDIQSATLPQALIEHTDKIFGLTINHQRLQAIRQQRMPNSKYASSEQCKKELRIVQQMFHKYHVPYLDSTSLSIEELATKIMAQTGLKRRHI